MYMVEKLDAGDMISQRKIPITEEDNTGTMFDKLSKLGAGVLMDTLPDFLAGKITAVAQDPEKVTFARNISREQEKINWTKPGRTIFNQIRGLSPWPVAYTTLEEKPFKIWEATFEDTKTSGEPGTILTDKSTLKIVAGDGTLIVPTVIQPAGKPKMDIHSFMSGAGRNLSKTTRFGE